VPEIFANHALEVRQGCLHLTALFLICGGMLPPLRKNTRIKDLCPDTIYDKQRL
jgi:hypothetical protein